jgi:hypothetical protein
MGLKREVVMVLYEPKKNSVRYNQVKDSNTKETDTLASFYIPNCLLNNTKPKVLKITIEEVE